MTNANTVAWKILNSPEFRGRIIIVGNNLGFCIAGLVYYVGPDDQSMGAEILNVVKAYQRKHGEIA